MKKTFNFLSQMKSLIEDDYEARACRDIDDDACREVSGNYILLGGSLVLTKLADTFASAKIVLPWLMAATGAPMFLTSLLVPIRESGSMLPQLLLGAYIRLKPVRKGFLVAGAALQAAIVGSLIWVAAYLEGTTAGLAIVVLTILFSLSRAISSIANKDVTGKTIPKAQRGRLSGTAASIAGAISIGFGAALLLNITGSHGIVFLLLLATVCLATSAISYGLVKEYPGATAGGVNAVKVAIGNLTLLRTDPEFGRFVVVRGLMISSGLAAPYFVVMTQTQQGNSLQALGLLIILSGAASFISGGIWGRLADGNSRGLLSLTAILNALICLIGSVTGSLLPAVFSLGLFFLLSIVHEGIRQARKTYLIDMANGNKRTDYVSVSNSVIGLLLLIIGVFSGVIAQFSTVAVMLLFACCSLLAAILSLGLKNVSQ